MCGRFDEDGGHLFFKCKNVCSLWSELQLEHARAHMASMLSAKGVVDDILKLKEET